MVSSSFLCLQHAATDLVELDGLEQGAEVALAESLVALALDDLEEDRPDHVLREDLQQDAVVRAAVDQDAPLLHPGERLAVPGDARVDALVVRVRRVLELDAVRPQRVDARVDVRRRERDVLDALAVVLADVLLDLALVVLALVDRDADPPAGARHRAAEEAGLLPLDVEVADLAEV